MCFVNNCVSNYISRREITGFGFSAVLFSWLCALYSQCLLCFALSHSWINEVKLASRRSWILHRFWASMQMSSLGSDKFAFLTFIDSYISSFVSFLLVNICQLMCFQECRGTWCQISVLNSVPFWLQCKTTVTSFKLFIWQLEEWYWMLHQLEGASFGALQPLIKWML